MKNSNIFLVYVFLLGIIFTSACSIESDKNSAPKSGDTNVDETNVLETVNFDANYIKYTEESKMFEEADLVVLAKVNKSFEDREHVVKYLPSDPQLKEDVIEDFYTKTPITIKKVLKKTNDDNIDKKGTLNIIEPVSIIKNKDKRKKFTTENYLELKKGEKYVLYLKKNTFGEYSVINMNNGRFNMNVDDEFKNKQIDKKDKETHKKMKQEIKKKYKKEISEL
ncbi:hypothetical protein NC797_11640 [Aquibacillus sp. 3ASR75-11]|uniref:Lipoprotein n=1 Tax=Terrihalobacillus insolitus TaxID=2950438 RepID=A0A9X3WSH0_9BACI|nr:hypothetical protein [Terrihalobacillus insolitus]MDC3413183.1 hypothetical protein [Terrihalobacillus insolitus]MDC3425157.1 hypothetical protein [Terrihalobacillus insolitus]